MFLRALTAAPHSQQLLSPMTHTEDIQRVCQQGGHSARGPPTKPPLSPALGWHKGPRSGVSGKTAAPHTPFLILFLSFSLSFFSESAASNLLPLSPLPFLLLPLHPFPTPFFPLTGLLGPLSERPLPFCHSLLVPSSGLPTRWVAPRGWWRVRTFRRTRTLS